LVMTYSSATRLLGEAIEAAGLEEEVEATV